MIFGASWRGDGPFGRVTPRSVVRGRGPRSGGTPGETGTAVSLGVTGPVAPTDVDEGRVEGGPARRPPSFRDRESPPIKIRNGEGFGNEPSRSTIGVYVVSRESRQDRSRHQLSSSPT